MKERDSAEQLTPPCAKPEACEAAGSPQAAAVGRRGWVHPTEKSRILSAFDAAEELLAGRK